MTGIILVVHMTEQVMYIMKQVMHARKRICVLPPSTHALACLERGYVQSISLIARRPYGRKPDAKVNRHSRAPYRNVIDLYPLHQKTALPQRTVEQAQNAALEDRDTSHLRGRVRTHA